MDLNLLAPPLLYPLLAGVCGLDGVLPMVPSDAAVLAAGVLTHDDARSLLFVVVATTLGMFAGDHLAYGVSRGVVGRWLLRRSHRADRAVAVAHRHLDRRAVALIVGSRFVPGGRVVVNVACGTARLPLRRFSPASALAALVWAAYITGLGLLGGAAFAGNPLLGIAAGLGLSVAFGGIVELLRRRRAGLGRSGRSAAVRALATVTAAAVLIAAPPAIASDGPDRAGLQRALDDVVAAGAVGALAEVRDGTGVWRGTGGVAERGTTRPVPVDGRFRAGSVTKAFVATVVLQLVAEGRVRLDDTVEAWLPGLVPGGSAITVQHLLHHTSGLYDYLYTLPLPPDPAFLDNRWRTWSAEELIRRAVAHDPTSTVPGAKYAYSNTGYLVLGRIIERATGHPYDAEIERRIIRPLGLRGTSLPGAAPGIPGPHPHGYVPILQGTAPQLVDLTRTNPSVMSSAGSILSTTEDLNRFFGALLAGRLLPAHLLAAMKEFDLGTYGLGLSYRDTSCRVRVFGHEGDALAYQAWSFVTQDGRRRATVAFTPDFSGDPDGAVKALLDRAFCG
jgi:D-alanyl-D-alanine carboxypeptidase